MTTRSPSRRPSPLARREFRLYFFGNATSNVGNWISNVALAVTMHQITGSSFWVGLVGLGLFLPVILFALPAGVLADRLDRIKLLGAAQAGMAILSTLLTVLVATGLANRYAIAAISFGLGTGIALGIPSLQALIPILVPPDELSDAIQLNALTFNIARALGPVLAAGLLVALGPTWAFAINSASFVPLLVALALIRRPPFPRAADRPPGPIREGIAYAWRHLHTRWMLLAVVAIGIALDPIITLSPALANRLGLSSDAAGWIVAAWGAGAAGMIIVARPLIRVATEHGLGWLGLLALFAGVAGLGLAPWLPVALVACVVAGAGYITATMAFTTTIQQNVPESLRGRVSALWTLAFLGPRAIASVLDGGLADRIGARATTVIFALVALGAALALRRVETPEGEPIPPPA